MTVTTDDLRHQFTRLELQKHDKAMQWISNCQWSQLLRDPERIIWPLLGDDEAQQLRADMALLSRVGAPLGKSACARMARDPVTRWDDLERLCWLVGESPLDYQTLWLENDLRPDPEGSWLEGFTVAL